MNGNQIDANTPQFIEIQNDQTEVGCVKKYMVVDPKGETVGFTRDKHLASSVRQLHQFVMSHFAQLTVEEIELLSSRNLEQALKEKEGLPKSVSKAKKGLLSSLSKAKRSLFKKINSAIEFVANLSKTEKTLIKEIQAKVMEEHKISENMMNDFCRELERDGLKEKLETILVFKNKLENAESQIHHVIDFVSEQQADSLLREVEEVKDELLIQQRTIKSKKMRKQIKALLEQTTPSENDSYMVQEGKKRILQEHAIFIEIMQPHIEFNTMSEIKLFFPETEKSSRLLNMKTNFSDQSMKGENGYYARSPEDSSVEKLIQPYK